MEHLDNVKSWLEYDPLYQRLTPVPVISRFQKVR